MRASEHDSSSLSDTFLKLCSFSNKIETNVHIKIPNPNIMKFYTQLISVVLPALLTTNLLILHSSAFQVTPTCRQHGVNNRSSLQNAHKDAPHPRMRISSELALFQDFSNEGDDDHGSFMFSESDRLRIQQQYER